MLAGRLGRRGLRIVSVCLLILAVAVAIGTVSSAVTSANLRARGVTVNATIVNVQLSPEYSSTSKSYRYSYTDLVEFGSADGVRHQASIQDAGDPKVGDTLVIVYDPSHPGVVEEKSRLTGTWWIAATVFLLLALLLGWLAIRLWRRAPRMREARPLWADAATPASGSASWYGPEL
jgi:hypothetical protein